MLITLRNHRSQQEADDSEKVHCKKSYVGEKRYTNSYCIKQVVNNHSFSVSSGKLLVEFT